MSNQSNRERVVIAMSGGVDSSVAAALVVRAGYEAIGVTLKLLPKLDSNFGCCGSPRDVADAKRVCETLGIPHYVLDMSDLFEDRVVAPFVNDYLRSRTPNPCVECNRSVKFGYLLKLLDAWNARYVATGHYARIEDGRLLKALDESKDQTYFLYSLTPETLTRVLFPIGGLPKPEVRHIARELGLATADKPESQEICFVPGGDYRALVRSREHATSGPSLPTDSRQGRPVRTGRPATSGPIINGQGRILGRHDGLENYTIGQRKGLGISSPEPLYVTAIDPDSNVITVGPNSETLSAGLIASRVSWIGLPPPIDSRRGLPVRRTTSGLPTEESVEIEARIRHRHAPALARLRILKRDEVRIDFQTPQRAVTPGQAVVFYQGAAVLGGGTIQKAL